MKNASVFLSASVKDGAAVIGLRHEGWFRFIGASCTASLPANSGGMGIQSVSVSVEKGRSALVAICATKCLREERGKSAGYDELAAIIPIHWNGDKMIVDLDSPFIPLPGRLCQVEGHYVVVTARNQRFVSSACNHNASHEERMADKVRTWKLGNRRVEDPNILCKFLIGDITLEELEEVASRDGRSATEIELAASERNLRKVSETNAELLTENSSLKKQVEVLETFSAYSADTNSRLGGEFEELRGSFERLTAKVSRISDILRNNGDQWIRFGFLPRRKVREMERLLS